MAVEYSPSSVLPSQSTRLPGIENSLTAEDLKNIALLAAEREYNNLLNRKEELMNTFEIAKAKLKGFESDYRFRQEEKKYSKEDVSYLCKELLSLSSKKLPKEIELALRNFESNPEVVLRFHVELKEILFDLIQAETRRKEVLEEAQKTIPSQKTIVSNEQTLK